MKKILVLGAYYSSNLGDGVICQCVAERLRQNFPNFSIEVADLVDRSGFTEQFKNSMEVLLKRRLRPKLRRIATKYFFWDKQLKNEEFRLKENINHIAVLFQENWDAVVIAGGQLFMDRYALFLEAVIQKCDEKNIPVFLNACGTGPTASRVIRKRLSEALKTSCVKLISSRDDVNQIKKLYLDENDKVISTFDPALWTNEIYGIKKQFQAETIGLGIMYTESMPISAVISFWRRTILELEKRQLNWKIFVNGSGDDETFAKYVISKIPELSLSLENYMVSLPHTPIELVETIAGFQCIISFRLHSHIIAASLDIPSIAIVWDDKLRFFFEKIGFNWRCCTIHDNIKEILSNLEKAKQTGYDQQLLSMQKKYADELLSQAIRNELEGM